MAVAFLIKVSHGITLTPMNYESKTSGKTVFINFSNPTCAHCKNMQPAWDKLTADYAGHEKFLVASVDCSTEMGMIWCRDTFQVDGTPEIWYGSPEYHGALLEFYEGGRSYEELATFAQEVFAKPLCSKENMGACSEENKVTLEALLKADGKEPEIESKAATEKKDTPMQPTAYNPSGDVAYTSSDEL